MMDNKDYDRVMELDKAVADAKALKHNGILCKAAQEKATAIHRTERKLRWEAPLMVKMRKEFKEENDALVRSLLSLQKLHGALLEEIKELEVSDG